ncbi:MAG: lipocalin family protein [Rhodanobacter sp.]
MFRLLLALVLLLIVATVTATDLPNRPVSTMELSRYEGSWHEIAHIPVFYQRRCTGPATATYIPNGDGRLRVLTTCNTSRGLKSVDGVARYTSENPGAFKVRFAPDWLRWLPQAWIDYWVIDIDPDYHWAVIGEPGGSHLWIMSRNTLMSRRLYDELVARARQRGYPVKKLVMMSTLY